MKAESTEQLPAIGYSRGWVILRYNFQEIQKDMGDGQEQLFWTFEYIMAVTSQRADLIDALIASKYTKAAEIVLINNKDLDNTGATEYAEYQAFRAEAKTIVDKVS